MSPGNDLDRLVGLVNRFCNVAPATTRSSLLLRSIAGPEGEATNVIARVDDATRGS
jgi:hypothetical protein